MCDGQRMTPLRVICATSQRVPGNSSQSPPRDIPCTPEAGPCGSVVGDDDVAGAIRVEQQRGRLRPVPSDGDGAPRRREQQGFVARIVGVVVARDDARRVRAPPVAAAHESRMPAARRQRVGDRRAQRREHRDCHRQRPRKARAAEVEQCQAQTDPGKNVPGDGEIAAWKKAQAVYQAVRSYFAELSKGDREKQYGEN